MKRTPNPTPTDPHVTDRTRDCPRTDSAGSRSAQLALNLLPGPVRYVGVRWSWVWCPFQSSKSAWFVSFGSRCLNRWGCAYLWILSSLAKLKLARKVRTEPPTAQRSRSANPRQPLFTRDSIAPLRHARSSRSCLLRSAPHGDSVPPRTPRPTAARTALLPSGGRAPKGGMCRRCTRSARTISALTAPRPSGTRAP